METEEESEAFQQSVSSSSSVAEDSNSLGGASLDFDRHSGIRNQTEHRHGFPCGEEFGESFMLEDSFALGESFSCYEEWAGFPAADGPRRRLRETPDLSTVIDIEEDEEETKKENADEDHHIDNLEHHYKKFTLQAQTSTVSNLSVEARDG
jgi:hypothetical protein